MGRRPEAAEERREGLPPADAHRHDAKLEIAPDEVPGDPQREHRTSRPCRMTQRDGATVGIRPLGIETDVTNDGDRLGDEGLVELDGVHVLRGQTSAREQVPQRRHGRLVVAHKLHGRYSGRRV